MVTSASLARATTATTAQQEQQQSVRIRNTQHAVQRMSVSAENELVEKCVHLDMHVCE